MPIILLVYYAYNVLYLDIILHDIVKKITERHETSTRLVEKPTEIPQLDEDPQGSATGYAPH